MRVIGGTLGGRRYTPPTRPGLRPLTDRLREALFNLLAHRLAFEGLRCFDLFSGSGSFSYECLSRGAAASVAVDLDAKNVAFIRKTATEFGIAGQLTVQKRRVEQFLKDMTTGQAGLIMLDPPYKLQPKHPLIEAVFAHQRLTATGLLVLHHPSQEHYETLPGFQEARSYGQATISLFGQPVPTSSESSVQT